MRLELTVCKEGIDKVFSISPNDVNAKVRVKNNILAVSEELQKNWEEYFESKNMQYNYQQWFATMVLFEDRIKKIKDIGATSDENDILLATSNLSKDKLLVAKSNIIPSDKRAIVKYVSIDTFNSEKKHRVEVEDIRKLKMSNRTTDIFNLYETPITVDVKKNSNSKILAEYLSEFYSDSNKLVIQDMYLDNPVNTQNLREYILPYIDKEKCEITLNLFWGTDSNKKRDLERKFKDFDGYKVNIIGISQKDEAHSSFIESDKYKINLGYRLRIFGENNKTECEIINITQK